MAFILDDTNKRAIDNVTLFTDESMVWCTNCSILVGHAVEMITIYGCKTSNFKIRFSYKVLNSVSKHSIFILLMVRNQDCRTFGACMARTLS